MKKQNSKKWESFRKDLHRHSRTFQLLLEYQPGVLVMGVTVLADSLLPFVSIYLSSMLINALYAGEETGRILLWALLGAGLTLLLSVIRHVAGKYKNVMWWEMKHRMARPVMEKTMKMDFPLAEDEKVHQMRARQAERTKWRGDVFEVFLKQMEMILAALLKLVFGTVTIVPLFFLYTTDGRWMGAALLPLLIFLGVCLYIGHRFGAWSIVKHDEIHHEKADQNRLNDYMMNQIVLSTEAGKDVRIFHEEELVESYGSDMTRKWREVNQLLLRVDAVRDVARGFLGAVSGVGIYLYMGLAAFAGLITAGSIVRYAGSIQQMIQAVSDLLSCWAELSKENEHTDEYQAYLDLPDVQRKGTIPVEKRKDGRFLIEFRHVSFAYPGTERYVLKDMNVSFEIGGRMALVGRNGSGKSTFIKLLCRLYDPTEGEILLNGVDIRKYDQMEYRKLFSVVFQDFQIFSLPLGEVIAGSSQVAEERAMDAIARAGLESLLARMPHGLDTLLNRDFSEEGITVSGGEAQKIAMARAIYKDAPFVILDEPTAALDPLAEQEIYTGFHEVIGDKTALFISHRLSACRFAQEILVFEDGRAVQKGSHEALLGQEGLYRRMWEAQAQYYQPEYGQGRGEDCCYSYIVGGIE